jgi:hypothetical protein
MIEDIPQDPEAKAAIDALATAFFALFSNKNGVRPDLTDLHKLFVPEGRIIKATGSSPEICTLQEFIEPRQAWLSGGILVDFEEWEESERTLIFGHIAHRISVYGKSGRLSGQWFSTRGLKSTQFIHTPQGWKMLSAVWDDEREGLSLPQAPA